MNNFLDKNIEHKGKKILQTETLLREEIEETDKIIKNILNTTIFLGAFSFLIVGISSYIKFNIIKFLDASQIIFFPQGLTMCFYGSLGLILSINQILIGILKIGEGFNEFDKNKKTVRIFRKGFPQKNSDVDIVFPLDDIVRTYSLLNLKSQTLKYNYNYIKLIGYFF